MLLYQDRDKLRGLRQSSETDDPPLRSSVRCSYIPFSTITSSSVVVTLQVRQQFDEVQVRRQFLWHKNMQDK